jgi:hypothetical protein
VLVLGIATHGFHQIGDEARTAFELNVDTGPRFPRAIPAANQIVVKEDRSDNSGNQK